MDLTSPEMKEIADAIAVLHQGDKPRARGLLLELWEKISPTGSPLQICAMAHFLADTEADTSDELEWDLRALEAATGSRESEDRDALSPELESSLPSLHLSVGDCYLRLEEFELARLHVLCAASRSGLLPDDGYGKLLRRGLGRLEERLATH